ncbi:MAG: valine--tRNA ligase, partial [Thermoplasmata archaeon]|nr:valine--tRNA ligase [Thermoplasmata archaeon]
GFNVMFPLCIDVNGMPIEVNVERKHNIKMRDYPRQEFIKLCTEFADNNIQLITDQFKLLGDSMDPSIFYRTDAEYYRRLTQISFIKLYKRGLIYKGLAPVNWCPRCGTALADAEVEYKDKKTNLNYIHFGVQDLDEDVLIATTRPELICTCQMVAVSPKDEAKKHLVGKKLITPIYGREIEIVADPKVDPEFGTGIVMICSIGDKEDLEWIYKYKLAVEKGIDENGLMTELAGKYEGLEIEKAKAAIIEDLKRDGLLIKQEPMEHSTGTCWRCRTPIEFLQAPQWFLSTLDARQDILRIADELDWNPEFMKIRLQDWVNSLNRDWVISRQRYFATPIPLWECNSCGEIVLPAEEDCYVDPTVDSPPVDKCPDCGSGLSGCEEVFDTWMDSSISPLYCTMWQRDEEQYSKLFPMSLRTQGQEIIRTWAFYTILRSHYLTGKKPWDAIMVDGFILGPDGKPMHASDGNVVNPLELLEEYGTDAWRFYSSTVPIGEDTAIQIKDIVHGTRFCAKLWNVHKFMSKAARSGLSVNPEDFQTSDKWILTKYSRLVESVTKHYDEFRFDRATKELEQFVWHELADHYLEMIKHRDVEEEDALALTLYEIGLGTLKMLAPVMPHIADEIYELYYKELDGSKSITISEWPGPSLNEPGEHDKGEILKEIIASVRNWKSEKGLPLNAEIGIIEIIGDVNLLLGCEKDIAGTLKAGDVLLIGERELVETPIALKPKHSVMGPKFKQDAKHITDIISKMDPADGARALETGELDIKLLSGQTVKIEKDMVDIIKVPTVDGKEVETVMVGDFLIIIGEWKPVPAPAE